MQAIENIFQEYTRLRLNGLDAGEAVSALHPYVAILSSETREELAQYLRAWETKRTEAISPEDRIRLAAAAKASKATETIPCPKCQRPNLAHELICYACGGFLDPEQHLIRTNVLLPKTGELQNDAYFGGDMVLVIMPESNDDAYVLSPQKSLREITIGRGSPQDHMKIDVDLERLHGKDFGVSRLHASLRYDVKSDTLALMDLGSTNGSFLNEQRIHPNERRVLRNGDTVRFGRLNLRVIYRNN